MSDAEALTQSIPAPIYVSWAREIHAMQDDLARDHSGIQRMADELCIKAWKIGRRLIECREATHGANRVIPFGVWKDFIAACGMSEPTAWRYSQLARLYPTQDQLLSAGLRKGYLALLVPAKAGDPNVDDTQITKTANGKYMRAANDLHKVLNNIHEFDQDTVRNDLRLLFAELAKLFQVELPTEFHGSHPG